MKLYIEDFRFPPKNHLVITVYLWQRYEKTVQAGVSFLHLYLDITRVKLNKISKSLAVVERRGNFTDYSDNSCYYDDNVV